jgi:hypothetical protein
MFISITCRDCTGLLSVAAWSIGILNPPELNAPKGVRRRIDLKTTVFAILTCILLLSAAMPAFAGRHHRHHHHHHTTVIIRP